MQLKPESVLPICHGLQLSSCDVMMCWPDAGSPLLSREGWKRLLEEQGFEQPTAAGESLVAPPLLSRQSVVLGISDGSIQLPTVSSSARAAAGAQAAHAELKQQAGPSGTGAQVWRPLCHVLSGGYAPSPVNQSARQEPRN